MCRQGSSLAYALLSIAGLVNAHKVRRCVDGFRWQLSCALQLCLVRINKVLLYSC